MKSTLSHSRPVDLAVVLEDLAEGLRAGRVIVTHKRRRIVLFLLPRSLVKLKVGAEQSGRKERVRIKITWDGRLQVG